VAGPDTFTLQSDVPLRNHNFRTEAEFQIHAGQRLQFALIWHPNHDFEPVLIDAEKSLIHAEEWWREWSQRCSYDGMYREPVVRLLGNFPRAFSHVALINTACNLSHAQGPAKDRAMESARQV
jgi:GH15 family glucan-1,4-alpha-glucosidase